MSACTWKTSVSEASNCCAPAGAGRLTRPRVHQLGRHPHAARAARLLPAHGAGQQVVRAQLAGDLASAAWWSGGTRASCRGRSPRGPRPGRAWCAPRRSRRRRSRRRGVAQVLEGEDGDDAGACRRLGAGRAVPPGEEQAAADEEAGGEGDGRDGDGGAGREAAAGRDAGGTAAAAPSRRRSRSSVTCSAWANCPAVANRSAGTGASACRMASSTAGGTVGRTARTLGGGSVSRLATMAWAVGPVNGGSPASIS